jgi:hypothetical protein
MSFDLGNALRRKGEFETARLDAFEFRVSARTMRLLAERLGVEPATLVAAVARHDDAHIIADLPGAAALYPECVAMARQQLISEFGDPTPHRLA